MFEVVTLIGRRPELRMAAVGGMAVTVTPPRDSMVPLTKVNVGWIILNGTPKEKAELRLLADEILNLL